MRHHASCRRVSSTVWLSVVLLLQISRAHGIDVSGCGRTKGCFRDPEDCDAESCEFFLAWHDNGTDSVLFEMSAPVDSRNAWVAFGLSKNAKMVTFCWSSVVMFSVIVCFDPFLANVNC